MKNYPEVIPVFPLSGVIYFPNTNLPLNIFEQRYLDLVNDIYNKDKLMGMIQPQKNNNSFFKYLWISDVSNAGIFPSHTTHFFFAKSLIIYGAGKGIRTLDLLVGNETLYH